MARGVSGIKRKWHCRAGFADTFAAVSDRTHMLSEAAWQESQDALSITERQLAEK